MAEGIQYLSGVAVDQLVDDPSAVAAQVQLGAEKFPGRLREFIFDAARAVGHDEHCGTERSPKHSQTDSTSRRKWELCLLMMGCAVFFTPMPSRRW